MDDSVDGWIRHAYCDQVLRSVKKLPLHLQRHQLFDVFAEELEMLLRRHLLNHILDELFRIFAGLLLGTFSAEKLIL